MTHTEHTLAKVYLFSGDDTVSKEAARARALEAIRKVHADVLVEFFDPSAGTFAEYLDKIMMPTLFGDIRVFVITRAESLGERELKELDTVLAAVPEDAFIIIDVGTSGKKRGAKNDPLKKLQFSKREKDSSGCFVVRAFKKPPDYKVALWVVENARDICGRRITKDVAELLVDLAGYDIAALSSELQKIDLQLEENEPVDADTVRTVVGASRQMSVFELANACGEKNAVRVLEILDSLFSTVFSVPMMISVLYRQYGALLRIRWYAHSNPQDVKVLTRGGGNFTVKNEAAFRVGVAAGLLGRGEERKVYPVIIASGIVPRAQRYTEEELRTILGWLLEFDAGVKTGRVRPSRMEVELFCYRLMRVTELAASGFAA